MKLSFTNCPEPAGLDKHILPEKPLFATYEPDFALMEKYAKDFQHFKNIVIIAHGGSITTFLGYYNAFKEIATKKAYFLSTTDPDYIFELKQQLKLEETLVIAISKSGETTTQIEALMEFANYPMLVITGETGTLREIGEKLHAHFAPHPPIGGRYTGLTEVALLPAALCGLDVKALFKGAQKMYSQYETTNDAWRAASTLYQLEEDGYVDVFMPFYTHNLFPMSNLIVQLCHESFGKAGRGQTYFAHEAPESQHHTNQRFFGGQKNMCAIFTTLENFNHKTKNVFPPSVHSVTMKGHHLADISGIPLEESMCFEAEGTMDDAKVNGIPFIHLSVGALIPEEIGELVAFWQLYAVYGSVLRSVDPFDQPQVENSKVLSFNKRLGYKGVS